MTLNERRDREKQQRRKAILEQARRLFLQKGYAAVSQDELATACELAKGTLYLYFPGKAALLGALCREAHQEMSADFRRVATSDGPPGKRLNGVGLAFVDWFRRHRETMPLLEYSGREDVRAALPDALRQELETDEFEPIRIMSGLIAECREAGYLKKQVEPMELACLLAGSSMGLVRMAMSCGELLPGSPGDFIRKGWALVLDGLVEGGLEAEHLLSPEMDH